MRAFERQEGESTKAFEAFKIYRDLGHERSLQKAAELYYGHAGSVRQAQRWSKKFAWVERAQSWDDWYEMIRREAVEEHLRAQAEDHGRREAALKDRALGVREVAMSQAEKMLAWPLTEQRRVDEGDEITYIFKPAGWNKGTAIPLYRLAVGDRLPENPDDLDLMDDFDQLSEEELQVLVDLTEKIGTRPEGRRNDER